MKKRIYVGAGMSALIAITALVVASLAKGATATVKGDVPDPPLMARFSTSGHAQKLGGLRQLRVLLLARSKTDMPVPNVKVYIKFYTHGDVRFVIAAVRKMGMHESFYRSKSVKNEWIWSMDGAPANGVTPARLGLPIYFLPLKHGQSFSFTVWGTTSVGSKATPPQSYIDQA